MRKAITAIMMMFLGGIFALNGIVYAENSGDAVSRSVLMHPSPSYPGPLPEGSLVNFVPTIQAAPSSGTATILVIMIDFPDQAGTESVADINTLMFGGTTGSLDDYYDEVSYGTLSLTGNIAAGSWYTSANNMTWWGADSGPYPNIDDANEDTYELAREAVVAADAHVDFSAYDTNGNNVMDPDELSLCIIHAGNPQDDSGVPSDIWSHRWHIYGSGYVDSDGNSLSDTTVDGVRISRHPGDDVGGYWMQSEFSPMGTFAHEFGHDLGLPDLYDTDYSSDGIGDWGLMAHGSWNEIAGSSSPAHPCAWCKIQLGWITPIDIDPTLFYDDQSVPQIETNPTAYKLAYSATEYFLVANRQQTGYDSALPGEGILIWHIDESMSDNNNEAHKQVDLEEAHGGIQDLDFAWGDIGDFDDPYLADPTGFTDTTDPDSMAYDGSSTGVMVTDISATGTTMTVDFGEATEDVEAVSQTHPNAQVVQGFVEPIDVVVRNNGANTQTFDVDLYADLDTAVIGDEILIGTVPVINMATGESRTITFNWDTTDVTGGVYTITALADPTDTIPEFDETNNWCTDPSTLKVMWEPVADINGPYTGNEGTPITFDASGSYDDDGTIVLYEWDWDGDGVYDESSTAPTITHHWGDDYSGVVGLRVTDNDGLNDTDTTTVTVNNVAPTATIDSMIQPNPQFILPIVHTLTFTGSFTDPGWLDTHTATWDFGDGTVVPGTLVEENVEPDATGTATADHIYSDPGTYTVTLTITDDDGGVGTDTKEVIVVGAEEAKEIINEYIQSLPEEAFKGNPSQRKKAFDNMFSAINDMLADEEWLGAIQHLRNNIRQKADGFENGSGPTKDWIVDPVAQEDICMKIDDLTAYLETFL